MVGQESCPEFAHLAVNRQATDGSRDSTFGDIEAKFQKLSMNSRSAPRGILFHHQLDESPNLGVDYWPTKALGSRSNAPEQTKARSMPGDNRFWFNKDQDVAPCRLEPAKQNPKHSISPSPSWERIFCLRIPTADAEQGSQDRGWSESGRTR